MFATLQSPTRVLYYYNINYIIIYFGSVQFVQFDAFKSATENQTEIFGFLYNKTKLNQNLIEIFATVQLV